MSEKEKKCQFGIINIQCDRYNDTLEEKDAWFCDLCLKAETARQIARLRNGFEMGRYVIGTK